MSWIRGQDVHIGTKICKSCRKSLRLLTVASLFDSGLQEIKIFTFLSSSLSSDSPVAMHWDHWPLLLFRRNSRGIDFCKCVCLCSPFLSSQPLNPSIQHWPPKVLLRMEVWKLKFFYPSPGNIFKNFLLIWCATDSLWWSLMKTDQSPHCPSQPPMETQHNDCRLEFQTVLFLRFKEESRPTSLFSIFLVILNFTSARFLGLFCSCLHPYPQVMTLLLNLDQLWIFRFKVCGCCLYFKGNTMSFCCTSIAFYPSECQARFAVDFSSKQLFIFLRMHGNKKSFQNLLHLRK